MSYEKKYLKYKQKYQELKKLLGNTPHKLETENYTEMPDFTLTDTPTNELKQSGGADVNTDEVENDFLLTDTPTEEQKGGSTLAMADFVTTPPLESCAGQVNPIPNVEVPLPTVPQTLGAPFEPALAPVNNNLVGGGDEEINTTTDLSEIQNTEDIAKLFSQFGGKHRKDLGSSSSSSTTSDSESTDISDSDSF